MIGDFFITLLMSKYDKKKHKIIANKNYICFLNKNKNKYKTLSLDSDVKINFNIKNVKFIFIFINKTNGKFFNYYINMLEKLKYKYSLSIKINKSASTNYIIKTLGNLNINELYLCLYIYIDPASLLNLKNLTKISLTSVKSKFIFPELPKLRSLSIKCDNIDIVNKLTNLTSLSLYCCTDKSKCITLSKLETITIFNSDCLFTGNMNKLTVLKYSNNKDDVDVIFPFKYPETIRNLTRLELNLNSLISFNNNTENTIKFSNILTQLPPYIFRKVKTLFVRDYIHLLPMFIFKNVEYLKTSSVNFNVTKNMHCLKTLELTKSIADIPKNLQTLIIRSSATKFESFDFSQYNIKNYKFIYEFIDYVHNINHIKTINNKCNVNIYYTCSNQKQTYSYKRKHNFVTDCQELKKELLKKNINLKLYWEYKIKK